MGDRGEFRFAESVSAIFMKVLGWIMVGPLRKYRELRPEIWPGL
jgi:hypothetical protein